MKYELMLRSRASYKEIIKDKHEKFITALKNQPIDQVFTGSTWPLAPDPGSSLLGVLKLSKYARKGFRGELIYQYRNPEKSYPSEDLGKHDDFMTLEFNPQKINFSEFINNAIPTYIEAFNAYIACIKEPSIIIEDFEIFRRLDFRHGVVRLWPVHFLDHELCIRSFSLTPSQIADKLSGFVEHVSLISNGVYIVSDSSILAPDDIKSVDLRLRVLLLN
jgi:hypothetical protein